MTESDEELEPILPTTSELLNRSLFNSRDYSISMLPVLKELRRLAKDPESINIAREGRAEHNRFVNQTQEQAKP